MSALERAAEDIERGDYGLARQRLRSYLRSRGYDPDLLARIGRVCYEMHDPGEAGRYWLLSSAAGAEVEDAVTRFRWQHAARPRDLVRQLPTRGAPPTIEGYPPIVQQRLRRLGIVDELVAVIRSRRDSRASTAGVGWGVAIGVAFFTVVSVLLGIVGLLEVMSWVFRT